MLGAAGSDRRRLHYGGLRGGGEGVGVGEALWRGCVGGVGGVCVAIAGRGEELEGEN